MYRSRHGGRMLDVLRKQSSFEVELLLNDSLGVQCACRTCYLPIIDDVCKRGISRAQVDRSLKLSRLVLD